MSPDDPGPPPNNQELPHVRAHHPPRLPAHRSRQCGLLHYAADSLRAVAGATVAADPVDGIQPDSYAVAHCAEYVARAAALDSLAGDAGNGWTSTCPSTHSLRLAPMPDVVALAARSIATEPARATTCYLGLDCPE